MSEQTDELRSWSGDVIVETGREPARDEWLEGPAMAGRPVGFARYLACAVAGAVAYVLASALLGG